MAAAVVCHSSAVRTRGISGTRVSLNTCTSSNARSGPMISSSNAADTCSAVIDSTLATRFCSANAAFKNVARLLGVRHMSHSSVCSESEFAWTLTGYSESVHPKATNKIPAIIDRMRSLMPVGTPYGVRLCLAIEDLGIPIILLSAFFCRIFC